MTITTSAIKGGIPEDGSKIFFKAKVVSNEQTDQETGEILKSGQVQVRIFDLAGGTPDEKLPWALPVGATGGTTADYGSCLVPEKDSMVFCFFEDLKNKQGLRYIGSVHEKEFNPTGLFKEKIQTKLSGWTSIYPDIKFMYMQNGICIACSSGDSKEIVIFHSDSTWVYIDNAFNIEMKNPTNKIRMTDQAVIINNNLVVLPEITPP